MLGVSTHETPPVPFTRSYWVLPGRLLAGFYPGAPSDEEAEQKLGVLLDAGIRCVVNLVEEDETNWEDQPLRSYSGLLMRLAAERHIEVTYQRLPIRDVDVPLEATMQAILDAIDGALSRDQAVYVHCWEGSIFGIWAPTPDGIAYRRPHGSFCVLASYTSSNSGGIR